MTGARDMPRRYQVDLHGPIREHSRQFCDAIARLQHALEEDKLVAWHARHGGGAAHVAHRGGAPITRSTTKMSLGGAGIAPGKGDIHCETRWGRHDPGCSDTTAGRHRNPIQSARRPIAHANPAARAAQPPTQQAQRKPKTALAPLPCQTSCW